MKRVLLGSCVVLGLACGSTGPNRPACCSPQVARNFGYVGSYVADGGVTTQVQLIMNASGETQLTVVREGNAVSQTFQSLVATP